MLIYNYCLGTGAQDTAAGGGNGRGTTMTTTFTAPSETPTEKPGTNPYAASSSATPSPLPAPQPADTGLTRSDKIALGVGLGVGIPSAIAGIIVIIHYPSPAETRSNFTNFCAQLDSVNQPRGVDTVSEWMTGKHLGIMFPHRIHLFSRIRCVRKLFASCAQQTPSPPGSNKPTHPRINPTGTTTSSAPRHSKILTAKQVNQAGYKSGHWDGRQQGYREGYQRAIADLIHDAHLRRAYPHPIMARGQTMRTPTPKDYNEKAVGAGTLLAAPSAVTAPGALLSPHPTLSRPNPKLTAAIKVSGKTESPPPLPRNGPEWKAAMKASGTKIGVAMGMYMSGELKVNGKHAATVLRSPPCARCRKYGLKNCRVLDPEKSRI
ncbi:hypothetical protein Q9L58_007405 [Maublancomyces gigas]|uniref:Uncharacterized protein n=1 Tax=Discina gigas TaxID=1032678 RepID=A0ABR3GCI6_9PEZI